MRGRRTDAHQRGYEGLQSLTDAGWKCCPIHIPAKKDRHCKSHATLSIQSRQDPQGGLQVGCR